MSKNYVNNKEFFQVLVEYNEKRKIAADPDSVRIPNYVGECIYAIATRLATKPNFSGYVFKEELIGDGIENAVKAINNFNPDKTNNPFAYFTTVIYYAFLRRIDKEKRALYTKQKYYEHTAVSGDLYAGQGDSGAHQQSYEPTDYMNDFVETYENNLEKKREKRRASK